MPPAQDQLRGSTHSPFGGTRPSDWSNPLRRLTHVANWTALLLLFGTGVASAVPQDFFLHGTGPVANPPTLFLDTTAPPTATEKYKDSAGVNFNGGNPWKEVGTWPADPTLTAGTLSAVSDLHVWGGLKNSDDQGTNFDLRAEVFKNGALVASGLTRCLTGLTRPAANAQEVTVAFGAFPPAVFNGTSETLSLKLATRIGTNPDNSKCVPGHQNAVGLRVYFDATDRPARLGATFGAPTPGPLTQARAGHTAALLASGTVLLAGGSGGTGILNSAEVFDPVALTATPLTSTLTSARTEHSVTLLPQTETLLIAGQDSLGPLFSTELFNPSSQTFRALAPNVQTLRAGHTASLLLDGRVLITGGQNMGALSSVEAFNAQTVVIFKPSYDPEQGTFTVLPNGLNTARGDHTATTLADGRILLTGGRDDTGVLASAELFDQATEEFTLLSASLTTPRAGHTGTLLPDGRVLLLGGDSGAGAVATAEVFTPTTSTFTALTPGLTTARVNHTATLLPTGFVLIAGGQNSGGLLASTELYTPAPADTVAPTVQQVNPASGATGVDRTEILGVRFSEPVDVRTLTTTSVTLSSGGGPLAATISSGESGLMVFLVPTAPLNPGTIYTLSLTTAIKDTAGNALTAFTRSFTTVAAPTITNFTPTSGTPGTTVTITGTHFDPVASKNEVKFNGALATVTAASTTSLTSTVPSGATTGALTVTTRGGAATSATNFTVTSPAPTITGFTPTSGPVGTSVMISGQNFDAVASNNQVTFNGKLAIITTASSTTITTTVPQGAATGSVTVTTPNGTGTSPQPFTVTKSQDFTLSALPAQTTVLQGGQGSYALSVSGTGTFSGLVNLGVSGLPAEVTAAFSSPTLTVGQTAYLTLMAGATVPAGAVSLTLTGTAQLEAGSTTQSVPLTLQVQASGGQTAVSGQFLRVDGTPIPGVQVRLGTNQSTTNAAGNFLLVNVPSGTQQLMIDANVAVAGFPIYAVDVALTGGQTNILPPFRITPPPPPERFTPINNATEAQVFTDPRFPGVEVTLPAGVTITGWDGVLKNKLAIERLTPDQLAVPPPPGPTRSLYQLFFGTPMGGVPSAPLPFTGPNDLDLDPGQQAELWYYDASPLGGPAGWRLAGMGTVSADGSKIVSNPGVGIARFCGICGVACWINNQAGQPNPNPEGDEDGEPVNLATGIFTVKKTDLVLPGRFPISIGRTYNPFDPFSGIAQGQLSLGLGWALSVDVVLLPISADLVRLIIPGNSRFDLVRQPDGTYRNFKHPFLSGAVLSLLPPGNNLGNAQLRFKDGTVWRWAGLIFLAEMADRNGNRVTIDRSAGPIGRIVDAAGRALQFTSSEGRITQIRDPIGRAVQYSYDGNGRLITVTDPAGGVTRYTYDTAGRILSITDAKGIVFISNEYSPGSGRVLRQVQADGGVWLFRYQLQGATVTGPGCPGSICPTEESTERVAQGYSFAGGTVVATTVVTPRGEASTYRFNNTGFTNERTDPFGQPSVSTRDGGNLLEATTDSLGRKTAFTYDAAGNVLTITDPDNKTTTFTYEPAFNRVTQIKDALNQITQFTYDLANGNLLTTKDPLNNVTTIAYNTFGQPTSVTAPLNQTTTFEYDADGNVTATTDPLGNVTRREYDTVGRLIKLTDPRGSVTEFTYEALNRVTEITDAQGGVTGFTYDANGNLLTVTDAENHTTTYTYDSMDRLATRTDALGRSEQYEYDPAGNLIRFTDRKGQVSTFTYDALNRRIRADYAVGSITTFTYDAVGRLTRALDSVVGAIDFVYDALDRLVKEITPQGVVEYTYDALGRRTTMTVSGQQLVSYGYDAASRLVQMQQGNLTVGLGYDAAGRRTSLTYPNGTGTTYTYDNASRLTSITHNGPTGLIESLTYTYDAAGNRISLTRTNGTASLLPAAVQAAYDAANEQVQFNSASSNQSFDANGNLASQADSTGTTTYTWDARNRLTAITGPSLSASFGYDALGRRISKSINAQITQFLYDGSDIMQEIGGGAVGGSYLRSQSIDEPFVRQTASGNEYYHTDALGSAVALSDAGGGSTVKYEYEPFGKTTITGISANVFQYTGRESDSPGLYYYRARYYSSIRHIFLSEDQIEFEGGDLNLYRYVFNNPINDKDPNGEIVPLLVFCARGAAQSILFDVLTGRKISLGDAATDCLTGGLGKLNKIKKLAQKGKKGKGEPKGHRRGEDKPVKDMEKQFEMTEKQRDLYKEARDEFKEKTGRAPSDNLSYQELKKIAEEVTKR